nr:hypothetical protein [Xiamenia xianingshaonis]
MELSEKYRLLFDALSKRSLVDMTKSASSPAAEAGSVWRSRSFSAKKAQRSSSLGIQMNATSKSKRTCKTKAMRANTCTVTSGLRTIAARPSIPYGTNAAGSTSISQTRDYAQKVPIVTGFMLAGVAFGPAIIGILSPSATSTGDFNTALIVYIILTITAAVLIFPGTKLAKNK